MAARQHDLHLGYLAAKALKYPDRAQILACIALLGDAGYLDPEERKILNLYVDRINKISAALDSGRQRSSSDED